jgi:hypothetical protein
MPPVNRIGTGQVLEAHLALESSFGSGITKGSDTGLVVKTDAGSPILARELQDGSEATGSHDPADKINGRYLATAISIPVNVRLMEDAATQTQLKHFIRAGLGGGAAVVGPTGQTVLAAGSTTSVIKLTGASAAITFAERTGVVVEGQPREIIKVDGPANTITVDPPLSAVPANGAPIIGGVTYAQAFPATPFAYSVLRDFVVFDYLGVVPTKLSIAPDAKAALAMTLEGSASSMVHTGECELSAPVADGAATTWEVTNAGALSVGSLFDCDGETGIEVTAVDLTTGSITVVRGTGAAAHASGKELTPAWVSVTPSGEIAHGMNGALSMLDAEGNLISVPATSRSIEYANGAKPVEDEESPVTNGPTDLVNGVWTGTVKSSIYFRRGDTRFIAAGQGRVSTAMVFYVTAGDRGLAVLISRAESQTPSLAAGAELKLDLTWDILSGVNRSTTPATGVAESAIKIFTW